MPAAAGAGAHVVTVAVDDFYAAATSLVEATTAAMEPLVQSLASPTDEGPARGSRRDLHRRRGERPAASPVAASALRPPRAPLADAERLDRRRTGHRRRPQRRFSLRDRLSRGFGVFREREGGAAVSFDSVLDRSLVTSDVVAGPSSADHVVVTRRYQAAHNIGWFRFVEYSAVDDQGEPRGDLAPVADIVFPFDPERSASTPSRRRNRRRAR